MSVRFNIDEVFETAEQIERNGQAFYRRAAAFVKDDAARGLLQALADAEHRHEQTFARMRRRVADPFGPAEGWNPDDAAGRYLRALVGGRVFDPDADPAERLAEDASEGDVLHMAIGLEKDSILYYLGMKDAVPADLGRDEVDGIIGQEMNHITALCRQLGRRPA